MTISSAAPSAASARRVVSLNGEWSFSFASDPGAPAGEARPMQVPGIWQAQFAELRDSAGVGRLSRRVDVPAAWAAAKLFLVFEGVFHLSKVFVDGALVGLHTNAWTPFEVEVSGFAGMPGFELTVEANVPDDRDYSHGGFGELLHGKQDWYGLQGGIWKDVRLEARDPIHFATTALRCETDLTTHRVVARGQLSASQAGATIEIAIAAGDGAVTKAGFNPDADGGFDLALTIASVELWSPDSPALYDVTLTLRDAAGQILDTVVRRSGFRSFVAAGGKLVLNGAPFYMFGALDQDWYPEAECRHPTPEFLRQRFENAKAIGLNTLRCHVKIPDQLYLDLADELGLIVWLDMPYMEFLKSGTRGQLIETFAAAAANHGFHPSIAIWTIFNEGWGIDMDDNPDDRRFLIESFDQLKALVPTGLVVDNSPCFPRNYHVKTDIDDFHWYNGWPHQNADFARVADEFAARPDWSFSRHGDAQRSGGEPLICSEFGVWGLPHPRDILEKDGSEPWWFESGMDWNSGCAYPHGMQTRFRDARLGAVFGDLDGFVDAAQDTQYRALKFQIETLRLKASVSGYIITELNDCQWEANGLMDARNNLRAYAPKLRALQTPLLAVAQAEKTVLDGGETIDVSVTVVGAGPLLAGLRIDWKFGNKTGTLRPAGMDIALMLALTAPASAEAIAIESLRLTMRDAGGTVLGTNHLEFCIVPSFNPRGAPALFPADAITDNMLRRLDWPNISASAEAADVVVASRLTTPIREWLLAGKKALVIANDLDALRDPERNLPVGDNGNFPKMQIVARDGTPWDGRWMGAFSWRRVDGPWAGLPNGPMLDEHWIGLLPRHVLTGFRSTAFGGLVDAGMAVAWIHKAAAFSKRSFLGKGWLTVTTFDLLSDAAAANPLAKNLLLALARS